MPHIKPEDVEARTSNDLIAMISMHRSCISDETDEIVRTTRLQIIEQCRAELARRNDVIAAGGVQ